MSEFLKTLLSLSVAGTLLLLLILGLKPLYKNRFSRRWQYYIWIIAALRFLLPFTPDTAPVGWLFEQIPTAAVAGEDRAGSDESTWHTGHGETDQNGTAAPAPDGSTSTAPAPPGPASAGPAATGPVFSEPTSADPALAGAEFSEPASAGSTPADPVLSEPTSADPALAGSVSADQVPIEPVPAALHLPNLYVCLFFIWLAAALVLFTRRVTMYQGFLRHLKIGNAEVSDPDVRKLLADCRERLGIKTRVRLLRNAWISSPIMTGFFRPSIILPAEELEERELFFVFEHELHHYKQGDMFYKWLIQTVICVHWFNPFAYLLEREVNRACELSCDEAVIAGLDDYARHEYGDTLLLFSAERNRFKNTLASVTMSEGAKHLKERLGAIMNFKKKTKMIVAVSLMAALMLAVGGLAIGAYAVKPEIDQPTDLANGEAASDTKDPTASKDIFEEDGVGADLIPDKKKAAGDVEALKAIIQEQNAQGAKLPADLNDERYVWDKKGNLVKLYWNSCGLKGDLSLEGLASLTALFCHDNQLSSLDVSKNVALTELDCACNQLSSLDVSRNVALETLLCGRGHNNFDANQLSSLDVSKNVALQVLECSYHQLSSLDVSENTALTFLNCEGNQLDSLDVSRNTALIQLYCSDNRLDSLDVSKNTALIFLYCDGNQLDSLDVSRNTELIHLYCSDNRLSSLDVSKNTALLSLLCSNNQLRSLDVSRNTALTTFFHDRNVTVKSVDLTLKD